MSLKYKNKVKKLVSISVTSILGIAAKKKAIETTETIEAGKDGKNDKYLVTNFTQVSYI